MTDNPARVMEATESFIAEIDGERFVVLEHETRVAAGHDLVKIHPHRFRPVDENLTYEVEEATNNPGERRSRATAKAERARATA